MIQMCTCSRMCHRCDLLGAPLCPRSGTLGFRILSSLVKWFSYRNQMSPLSKVGQIRKERRIRETRTGYAPREPPDPATLPRRESAGPPGVVPGLVRNGPSGGGGGSAPSARRRARPSCPSSGTVSPLTTGRSFPTRSARSTRRGSTAHTSAPPACRRPSPRPGPRAPARSSGPGRHRGPAPVRAHDPDHPFRTRRRRRAGGGVSGGRAASTPSDAGVRRRVTTARTPVATARRCPFATPTYRGPGPASRRRAPRRASPGRSGGSPAGVGREAASSARAGRTSEPRPSRRRRRRPSGAGRRPRCRPTARGPRWSVGGPATTGGRRSPTPGRRPSTSTARRRA